MLTSIPGRYTLIHEKYGPEVANYFQEIRTKPDDPILYRQLYALLTDKVANVQGGFHFSTALLLKLLLEDLLRNTLEIAEIPIDQFEKVARRILLFFEAIADGDEGKWKSELNELGNQYHELVKLREQGEHITASGIKFFIARHFDRPLVNGVIDFFPSLDATLSDPETAQPVCKWYGEKVNKLAKDNEIDGICVIEKSYSTVGAVSLIGYLAAKCGLPITIYRPSYWDYQQRVSGKLPYPGEKVCVVYDVSISGSGIVEASEFLEQQYRAQVKHAVVLFDFDVEGTAQQNLKQMDIQLHHFRNTSDVIPELLGEKEGPFMLREYQDLIRKLDALERKADVLSPEEYMIAVEEVVSKSIPSPESPEV